MCLCECVPGKQLNKCILLIYVYSIAQFCPNMPKIVVQQTSNQPIGVYEECMWIVPKSKMLAHTHTFIDYEWIFVVQFCGITAQSGFVDSKGEEALGR